MKKSFLLFAALLSFAGVTMAQKSLPYSYGFEDYNLDTDGWTKYFGTSLSNNNNECAIAGAAKKTGSYGFRFSSYKTSGANAQYLISPELNAPNGVIVTFAWKVSHGQYSESFKVGYSTTDTDVSSFTWDEGTTSNSTGWKNYENTFPAGTKYVAIYYYSNYCAYLYVDDFSFTAPLSGPALVVEDGTTAINNGYNYSFGLATPGTTHYFRLSNPGTTNLSVSVSETGNFGATLSAPTIPAGSAGYVLLNITMPSTSGSSAITITPEAGSGIDPFVINVSGTIRDANKVYEYGFTALPQDWTTTGSWYYSEANGAYTTSWYLSSNSRLITPQLIVSEGETFYVEAKGYSTSNTSYQHLQMQYSADGTTWKNFGDEPALDPSAWNTFAFTGAPAGKYYIAINASQADIRMFYGGELPQEPKMVVTQPASLDFGVITDATTKTFTIANTGKATLEGINVTSSNSSIFAVTGAPTSLAAGESAEVTITMAATTTGALSGDITVSATGMDNVQFTVTGVVLPDGLMVVDFNDNQLPANWTNAASYKWSFSEGKAYCTSSAELVTPRLIVADGDMLAIKTTSYDDYDNNYLEVYGSTDGSSWSLIQKFISRSQIPYGSYATLVVTGIPTTTKYIKFKGYYVRVDEIAGLTYAPVLSVAQGGTTVSSPAAYDFGECAGDASVTYNFANTGAGTITITGVSVTGDGVAAYNTNWSQEAELPFDLTINRVYVAGREGSQNAKVTVTTTEGDFVINVTGTDKAANAPELAVTPTENAEFGVVTAATSKTYTVTNAGTGLLTVNIASTDAKFTVNPAQLADIAAGESKTFDVTFTPVAETYGVFTADITVTPTYDETAVFTFSASAKVKDPNVWSEDFSAGTAPTGWDAGANWTFADGVAKAAYAYGTTNYLTTPTLTVADESDELTFDYKATANYVSVKIQMSKDGGAFADYQTISGLNNGNAGTYTIIGLEAGDYQFRFANDDYELDNFEGFKLNLPDHIATITASTIPESSSWSVTMKEGRSFEATITVKEMRGVAEALTAKFYMGTDVIGTATGTVAANGTETLTITATPNAPAEGGVEMHIEVEYAGGTLATEPVTRYVAALTYLTLDETSTDAVVAGTYDNVTLKRVFAEGWNTVCLPFTISDVEAFFGTGAKALEFSSYANGELGFTTVTTLTASYPYVVYVPAAITEDIKLTGITIASNDTDPWFTRKADANAVYFRGTYAPVAAGEWTKHDEADIIYGFTTDGHIMKAGANASIKGFRAYFDISANVEVKALVFDGEVIDGILEIVNGTLEADEAVYNLAGQRVQKMQKGINIINGKKILK